MKSAIPFGKYQLLERINVGGMAEVFKAKSFGVEGFERTLAVKRILPSISEDKEFVTMFIDEAKLAVQLTHANIAQIFDLGRVGDSYFIALEYVQGKDLRAIFDRARKQTETLPLAMACYAMMKVCEGLDYAHNKKDAAGRDLNLVHRDVSPQNILVSYDGEVKIIDFGIAKAVGKASKTQAGVLKGKLGYMSPEQVRGLPLDRRSDVFSAGIVLYECLTGERLFLGDTDYSTMEKVKNVEIMPPTTYNRKIPDELEQIILKVLAKDPEDRYATAMDLHDDLQSFMYTSGNFFARKDLAAFMRKYFADDIAKDAQKEDGKAISASTSGLEVFDLPAAAAPRKTTMPPPPAPLPGDMPPRPLSLPPPPPPGSIAPRPRSTVPGMPAVASSRAPAASISASRPAQAAVAAAPAAPTPRAPDSAALAPVSAAPAPSPISLAPPTDGLDMGWEEDEMPTRVREGSQDLQAAAADEMTAPATASSPAPVAAPVPLKPRSKAPGPSVPPAERRPSLRAPAQVEEIPTGVRRAVERAERASRGRRYVLMGLVLLLVAGAAAFLLLGGGPTGTLVVRTDPVDTQVLVDARPAPPAAGARSPFELANIEVGEHTVTALREGYRAQTRRVRVEADQSAEVSMRLAPVSGETGFAIDSIPRGAEVAIDDRPVAGVTPLRKVDLAAGHHTIRITKGQAYQPAVIELDIPAGTIVAVPTVALQLRAVRLQIASEPAGAQVTLVDRTGARRALGPAPIEATLDPSQSYVLEFAKAGFSPATQPVQFVPGEAQLRVQVALNALAAVPTPPRQHPIAVAPVPVPPRPAPPRPPPVATGNGYLSIQTTPWSQVFVDGSFIRNTPLIRHELPAGPHRITCINSDFNIRATFSITVAPGQTLLVRRNLTQE